MLRDSSSDPAGPSPAKPAPALKTSPQASEKKGNQLVFLFSIYFILALPALGLLIAHKITDNPLLQPLNLDQEAMANIEREAGRSSLYVHVNWGVDHPKTETRNDLRNLVSRALDNRTDNYVFRFKDVPGTNSAVTFVVGPNSYGPYPPARMIDGIIPALAALELTERANR